MIRIKLLAMDVDGTLTNGKIYLGENGEIMKAFDVKDGYAIRALLPEYGITPVIITGRKSTIIDIRARELGVDLVFQDIKNKLALIKQLAAERGITLEEVAFIGDDTNDLECIKACGCSGCPKDASSESRACSEFISNKNGGSGAVREFIEYIIKRNLGA